MTEIDLYNEALLMIGSKPIDGTNGLNSDKGQACKALFAGVVEEVQSLIPWAELVKTTVLSPTGVEDRKGYSSCEKSNSGTARCKRRQSRTLPTCQGNLASMALTDPGPQWP